jgi:DNA polymerase V
MDENIFSTGEYLGAEMHKKRATEFGITDEYSQRPIDLNEQLIKNKPSTFFMRVNSDAMTGVGIYKGDVVIVDRSLDPKNGKVIIAVLDGELLIRKLEIANGKKRLLSVGAKLSAISVEESKYSCWGVVTYVIHSV